jgi:multisubunit Na+/H+ antiporter MnhC subunit
MKIMNVSKVMIGVSVLLFVLGVWQLVTRGVNFDNSSAIQFLTTAVILFGITSGSFKK